MNVRALTGKEILGFSFFYISTIIKLKSEFCDLLKIIRNFLTLPRVIKETRVTEGWL